jgi:peptide/nickel transport system substrate-binding protein
VAILAEPPSFLMAVTGSSTTTGGVQQPSEIAHNWLTLTDTSSEPQPALAEELPSLENGTWKVNPDGTMETTWRLRPNIKWHDGEPFTADDIVFGWEVLRDPAVPSARSVAARQIAAIETPDPRTLIMKWQQVAVDANDMGRGTIEPLPRHLLGDLYLRNKDAFINNPYWSVEFVGVGPFKVSEWVQGSHIDFTRFDDYYRGPAKVDRVVLQFITDPNAQVSALLAEEIDVLLPIGVDMEGARLIQERWRGTKNQVMIAVPQRLRFLSHQGRPDDQKQPALLDPAVRRALYQGVDRQALLDYVILGFGEPADSFMPSNHGYRKDVESAIPQYAYNTAAATRALADLGWTRGADGTIRDGSGAPLTFQLWATRNARSEKELPIIADGWRQMGMQVEERLQPPAIVRDPETWHRFPGIEIIAQLSTSFWKDRIDSREAAGPQNRWNGTNFGGYANPAVDQILDRLSVTIPRAERIPLMRQLLQESVTDMAVMPLYWDPDPLFTLAKVKNVPMPAAITQVHTWNVYDWDIEQ